jgi:hypothetical protein
MRKLFVIIIPVIIFNSCNKEEESNFLWEKSFGEGHAYYLEYSMDSGFVSCGQVDNYPFLVKLNKNNRTLIEFESEREGLFSSVWSDTSRFIAAGSSNGKMLLAGIDNKGSMLWDTLISASFALDITNLSYNGDGNLLAVATSISDSAVSGNTGILFVKFDTTGQIAEKKEIAETGLISVNKIISDESGNIFFPVTRRIAGNKTKANVAKYTADLNKLWETELFNNPDFGAESLGIIIGSDGTVFVSGNTELMAEEEILDNSFVVSLSSSGSINWKKYYEKSNTGIDLMFDENGLLMILNRNCFIVSLISPEDGSENGRLRMFDICDPSVTDAYGEDFDFTCEGNLMIAGSRGSNFYLALKSLL